MRENVVQMKSKAFAVRVVRLYQYLSESRKEFVLSKQLLRCGTSIGANVKEAIRGQSKADFSAKMNISLKEASESEYWLELLYETGFLTEKEFTSIVAECTELIKLLTSIVKTSRKE
ncbi:MAG: four helix bundle protein [Kiritimatiellaeota bacterium]|nr:four helix bundle protein [Kiritimatiellota bacterium]